MKNNSVFPLAHLIEICLLLNYWRLRKKFQHHNSLLCIFSGLLSNLGKALSFFLIVAVGFVFHGEASCHWHASSARLSRTRSRSSVTSSLISCCVAGGVGTGVGGGSAS